MVLVRNSDGYRVVRGPNWKHNDEDEGEGHVGTIQSTDSWDHKVEVEWKSRVVYNPGMLMLNKQANYKVFYVLVTVKY